MWWKNQKSLLSKRNDTVHAPTSATMEKEKNVSGSQNSACRKTQSEKKIIQKAIDEKMNK